MQRWNNVKKCLYRFPLHWHSCQQELLHIVLDPMRRQLANQSDTQALSFSLIFWWYKWFDSAISKPFSCQWQSRLIQINSHIYIPPRFDTINLSTEVRKWTDSLAFAFKYTKSLWDYLYWKYCYFQTKTVYQRISWFFNGTTIFH